MSTRQPQFASEIDGGRMSDALRGYLLLAADVLLIAVICLAPLVMAGRHPLGPLVYVTLISALGVVWVARRCLTKESPWRWSGAEFVLGAAVLLVVIQVLPIPETTLSWLSPQIAKDLTVWSSASPSAASLGTWNTVSLMPAATRAGLVLLLSYGLLFFIVVQRLRSIEDVEWLLRWIAVSVVFMASLGLIQYLAGNGKFLWIYEHPFRSADGSAKAAFANANHFAHFLALGMGPLIWCLQQSLAASRGKHIADGSFSATNSDVFSAAAKDAVAPTKLAWSFALVVVSLSGLLSFSRGGVVVMFLATTSCLVVYWWRRLLTAKSLAALTAAALVVTAALWIHGHHSLGRELKTMTAGSLDELDRHEGRRKIWAADLKAISRYWTLGSGIGTHREVYPTYFEDHSPVEFTHAESGYLQVLLEAGLPGLALLAAGILTCGWWGVGGLRAATSRRGSACVGAVVAGLVVSVVHSVFDFVWYVPACATLTAILAGCACRLYQLSQAPRQPRAYSIQLPRVAWVTALTALLPMSVAMIANRVGPARAASHWDKYLMLSLASEPLDPISFRPSDEVVQDGFFESTASMTRHLEEVVRRSPYDARANLRLAAMCLRLFDRAQRDSDNAMSLVQIRDAAWASRFPSRAAQDEWLTRAIGDNRRYLDTALVHTRRALRLCPLQGHGYVYLAELAFLDGAGPGVRPQYIGQALKIRPHDAAVLFAAGREAALTGQISLALAFWKQAFHLGPEQQNGIIAMLAPQLPASFFLTQFEPDVRGMRILYSQFRSLDRDEDARVVGSSYLTLLQQEAKTTSGSLAAWNWQQAQGVCRFMGDQEGALRCAHLAVQTVPNDFHAHHRLAQQLLELERFDEAIEELKWCLRRKPYDRDVKRTLDLAKRLRIDVLTRQAANPPSIATK